MNMFHKSAGTTERQIDAILYDLRFQRCHGRAPTSEMLLIFLTSVSPFNIDLISR